MSKDTIFNQLGGRPAIDVAVDLFYDKVLADPLVSHFFNDIDMDKQRAHQKKFMVFAFGGTKSYDGKSLRESHKHLNLNDEHFDAIAHHLKSALEELNIPNGLIAQVLQTVEQTRDEILNR